MTEPKWFLAGAALLLLAQGCVSLERSYPDKQSYALEVSAPAQPAGNPTAIIPAVLQVGDLRASPRYGSRSFVYRTSDVAYESDFYHEFVANPAALITDAVRKGIESAHLFNNVINAASSLSYDYYLEGTIDSLYGDFRNAGAGQAVIEIEFLLRRESGSDPGIVLQKRYSGTVPVSTRSAEALVKSWDQALGQIVAALGADLKAIAKPPAS
jgi:ABC-type uncharacterized transport system auxiliary subunit